MTTEDITSGDLEKRAERRRTELVEQGVEAIALGLVDPAGIVRTKVIPVRRLPSVARSGVGISTLFGVALSNDHFAVAPGFIDGPSGDLRLIPDVDAIAPLHAMPGWAWGAVDAYTQSGQPWGACPRSFLQRVLAGYDERGLSLQSAFEFEFSLGYDGPDGAEPAHRGPGYSDSVLIANHEIALECLRTFERQGFEVEQFHPEYTAGQFEVSVGVKDPLATVDQSLVLRQTTRAIAAQHGLKASFSPRTFGPVGNGLHLHLSLWEGDRNLMAGGDGPQGMTPAAESFIAGILENLPALVAVTCPSPLSYFRLQPHQWSGAMQCWGLENREAALRFVTGMQGLAATQANIEVKPVDGTSNPYLAMGAILATGLHGIERQLRLPPPTSEYPSELEPDVAASRGVRPLPSSLTESTDRLAASEVLREAMGDMLFETFVATRRGDHEQYVDVDEDEMVRQYRWRY